METLQAGGAKRKILVAPYWNLNTYEELEAENKKLILVAPYWNLNYFAYIEISIFEFHISSSILEFKYFFF